MSRVMSPVAAFYIDFLDNMKEEESSQSKEQTMMDTNNGSDKNTSVGASIKEGERSNQQASEQLKKSRQGVCKNKDTHSNKDDCNLETDDETPLSASKKKKQGHTVKQK